MTDRRQFLKSGAVAAAPLLISQRVFGANDRITFGVIGCGGRGRYLSRQFQKAGAECVALCDVYDLHLAEAAKDAPNAKQFVDYKDLLAEKNLDTVVIATPDHHHAPMLFDALKANKDVYLEKPLSKSLEESLKMIKAVRSSDRIVQVGMQRRSAPVIHQAKKLIDDGVLGQITLVKPQWHWNIAKPLDNSPLPGKLDWKRFLGHAKDRPLEPMRFRRWRYFFDYAGGNMTDQGTHLMDVVQWFTNHRYPVSAVCHGYVAKMTGAEHPDVFAAVFEYPNMMATWTLDYANSFQNGWSITFMGDKGTMILDESGYRVYAEPWKKEAPPIYEETAPVPIEAHIENFLECVRSRKQPNCTVEIAAAAVAGPHLANVAMFERKRATLAPNYLS